MKQDQKMFLGWSSTLWAYLPLLFQLLMTWLSFLLGLEGVWSHSQATSMTSYSGHLVTRVPSLWHWAALAHSLNNQVTSSDSPWQLLGKWKFLLGAPKIFTPILTWFTPFTCVLHFVDCKSLVSTKKGSQSWDYDQSDRGKISTSYLTRYLQSTILTQKELASGLLNTCIIQLDPPGTQIQQSCSKVWWLISLSH